MFDCDGVVLNSNKIKTKAFFDVAKKYGIEFAQDLKDYHVQNGGVSRYQKFEYFLSEILQKSVVKSEMQALLDDFDLEIKKSLMVCDIVSGLDFLRKISSHANWLIVSGGDQSELREIFSKRELDIY